MKFTERDRELTELLAALDRARLGQGTTVLVSGEAGIGKTSLITTFCDGLGARARVLHGTCEDLLTPRPLGPFRDMARGAAGAIDSVALTDRDALIDALLTEMSFVQRPAVVVVEDVQWADQASMDVLRFVIRRVGELPALLVISFREEDLGDDHPLLRVAAAASTAVLRIRLTGLSDTAVATLAAEAGLDPGSVVATVAGNPFYLSEVLAAPTAYVPTSVRHAIMARVADLPADCRDAVELLSVLPAGPEWALLSSLLDDLSVLDPAEAIGVLVPSYAGIHFRHELARRAVEEAMSRSRRQAAHRRVLDALVALEAEPSRLVHHAAALGDQGVIGTYAHRAAYEAARVHGHREVVGFAGMALGHGDLDRVRRAELHSLAAAAHYGMNQFGAASGHAERAVELRDSVDGERLEWGEALLMAARIRTLLADPGGARTRALRAVEVLEPLGPTRALAFGYSILGSQDAVLAHFEDALNWAERALATAEESGADDVVAHALNYRGVSRASLGDEEGLADLQRAIDVAGRLRHGDFETLAAHNLAVMQLRLGGVSEAESALQRAESVAREHNLSVALFRIEAQLCLCLVLRGRWSEAEDRLRALLASGDDAGANAVNPMSFLGRILARRGDPAAADLVNRAWALAVATGEDQKMAVAGVARIEWLWLAGDDDAVRLEGAELLRIVQRAQHRFIRAEVLRYLRRAGEPVEPFPGCLPAFAAGLVGDMQSAAALWDEAGNPYERALELSESPDPATVSDALRILDGLGASATAAMLRRRLRQAGVSGVSRGPRSSTRSDPGLLTERQRAVLDLIGAGLTNAEIADHLVLSRRTVDNHVAAVLQRLGVASRREAVRAATGLKATSGRTSNQT
jgi:DNA-binding CsgD family transcriptional regulator/tetratricopeptide (TPR) repeat protein